MLVHSVHCWLNVIPLIMMVKPPRHCTPYREEEKNVRALVLNSYYSLRGMCGRNLAGPTRVLWGNVEREAFHLPVLPQSLISSRILCVLLQIINWVGTMMLMMVTVTIHSIPTRWVPATICTMVLNPQDNPWPTMCCIHMDRGPQGARTGRSHSYQG